MPVILDESPVKSGTLMLRGYGIRIAVERGYLVAEDGVGRDRRRIRIPRPSRNLDRVIVIGHTGEITFDALRWLSDIGVGFSQIDNDGNVIAAVGPLGLRDPRLRRAQAMAADTGRGLEIARDLILTKLESQASVVSRLCRAPANDVGEAFEKARGAESIKALRSHEATGALSYWSAWSDLPMRFIGKDEKRVPEHWKAFVQRTSYVTKSPRKAMNPINAILNYLYAILETEARIACLGVGLDPGIGLMHADLQSRDSLAADLMEPIRPEVDAWVLDLVQSNIFRKADFFETRDGVCRLMPPLTEQLMKTENHWRRLIAPIAEYVAKRLLVDPTAGSRRTDKIKLKTPLTQENRSRARDGVRRRRRPSSKRPRHLLDRICADCGASVGPSTERCPSCRPPCRSSQTVRG